MFEKIKRHIKELRERKIMNEMNDVYDMPTPSDAGFKQSKSDYLNEVYMSMGQHPMF